MTTLIREAHTVTYLRMSEDPAGEEIGIQRQRTEAAELAERRGLAIVAEYLDNDISATNGKRRPEYERLLTDVAAGKVDTVIPWHISRLLRNRRERAEFIELAKPHNVRVLPVKGPELDLSSAYGRCAADLLGAVDSAEGEIKAERQASQLRQSIRNGEPPRCRRAFGYTVDGTELVAAEAEAVRQAHRSLHAGVSLGQIARDLNDQGFTTTSAEVDENGLMTRGKRAGKAPRTTGRAWTRASVRPMLLNPRYAALRIFEGGTHKGSWPQIVEEDVWRASVAILERPERRTRQGDGKVRYLGGHLYRCGRCAENGIDQTVESTRRRSSRGELVRVYKCMKCWMTRTAEPIDELVAMRVCERLSRPDAAELLVDDDRPDLDELRGQAEALRTRIRELGELFEEGDIGKLEYKERKGRMGAKLAGIEASMETASRVPILGDLIKADDTRAMWDTLDAHRQRAAVRELYDVALTHTGRGRRAFDPATVVFTPRSAA